MMGYGQGYAHGYGYGPMMGGGWLGGVLALLYFTLVVVGIVLLVMWAVRASHGKGQGTQGTTTTQPPALPGHDEAVAIAKRRLASGEITPEQYAEIMRTLSS